MPFMSRHERVCTRVCIDILIYENVYVCCCCCCIRMPTKIKRDGDTEHIPIPHVWVWLCASVCLSLYIFIYVRMFLVDIVQLRGLCGEHVVIFIHIVFWVFMRRSFKARPESRGIKLYWNVPYWLLSIQFEYMLLWTPRSYSRIELFLTLSARILRARSWFSSWCAYNTVMHNAIRLDSGFGLRFVFRFCHKVNYILNLESSFAKRYHVKKSFTFHSHRKWLSGTHRNVYVPNCS